LIDFGIARLFKPGQARDTIAFGSPGYAAPEQYGKAQTAPNADIYSLGAILHQMLTGRDPSTTPFSFPPVPHISFALQTLINQMLVLDAGQRISDAETVKQSLQRINAAREKNGYKASPATIRNTATSTAQKSTPASPPVAPIKQASPQAVPAIQPIAMPSGPPPTLGNVLYLYQNHTDIVSSLAWSPDSTRIASASYDKTIQINDITKKEKPTIIHRGRKRTSRDRAIVAWSPQGQQLATTGDDGLIQIWRIDPVREMSNYNELKNISQALAWSPDGTLLASTSLNIIRIWNPINGDTLTHFEGAYDAILTLSWSPDSTQLAIGYESAIMQVLRLDRQTTKLEATAIYMESRKNRNIKSSNGWQINHVEWSPNNIHQVVWSPDNIHIASASADKTIHVWDAATGKHQLTYHGHTEAIYALDWSPDGKSIVSSSADGTIQIWNAQDGRRNYTHPSYNPTVYALAWSPNGAYIASGAHSRVMVWQAT
jgi:WD40 repeat protein